MNSWSSGIGPQAAALGVMAVIAAGYFAARRLLRMRSDTVITPSSPSEIVVDGVDVGRIRAALQRILGRDSHRAVFAPDGDVLVILLIDRRAPQEPFLAGQSRSLIANAMIRGDWPRLQLRKVYTSGRVSNGYDLTRVLDAMQKATPKFYEDFSQYVSGERPRLDGQLRDVVIADWIEARIRWPRLQPFLLVRPASESMDSFEADDDGWLAAASAAHRLGEALAAADLMLFAHATDKQITFVPVPRRLTKNLRPVAPWVAQLTGSKGTVVFLSSDIGGKGAALLDAEGRRDLARSWRTDSARTLALLADKVIAQGPSSDRWRPPEHGGLDTDRRRAIMCMGAAVPKLAPLLHMIETGQEPVGFAEPYDSLPAAPLRPTPVRRRSVMFLHHCYYNFLYLSQALQRRGWDAVTVSLADPNSAAARFSHGEDYNLFDSDPAVFARRRLDFFAETCDRFGIVHTYGQGTMSLFPYNWDRSADFEQVPWDILEWKRRGVLIGYSHSGCQDMVSQSSFNAWSPGACARCILRDQPQTCSDQRNLGWGWKVHTLADLICLETEPKMDFKASPQAYADPLTFALDPEVWRPDLEPPGHLRRPREAGQVVIYHAVGNYEARTTDGINIKGTGAVMDAVERLKSDGLNVRLDFVHDLTSLENRFVQAQADIIVDQLNYGRYGATAREGMMLGKPVVGRVDMHEPDGGAPSQCIVQTPIVHADEHSVYAVLKTLVMDADLRLQIGRASREHALGMVVGRRVGERFERVYDALRDTGRVPAPFA